MHWLVSWFLHWAGLDDGSGAWYLWWSGIFSNLTIFAAAIGLYRSHNCHMHRCWRIAKHPVDGTPYRVCKLHHPDTPDGGIRKEHLVGS